MSIMYPPDDGPPIPDGPPSFAAQLEALDRPPTPPPPDEEPRPEPVEFARLASTYTPRRARFTFGGRIQLGAVNLLVGIGGLNKSTLTVRLAADASRGYLDGDLDGEPTNVLIASAEDGTEEVVVPRLMAARADMSHVHILTYPLVLPDDVDKLAAYVEEHNIDLLVIDPLVAFLSGDVDSHKDADIRRALVALRPLSEDRKLTAVPVIHLNKTRAGDIYTRISGSSGFYNAARSVMAMTGDPRNEDDDGARVLWHEKCNAGPKRKPQAVTVTATTIPTADDVVPTIMLTLGETVDELSIGDALDPPPPPTKQERAEAMVDRVLADGPQPRSAVEDAANAEGIGWRTVEAAKANRGVESRQIPEPGVQGAGPSWWRLPGTGDWPDPQRSAASNPSHAADHSLPVDGLETAENGVSENGPQGPHVRGGYGTCARCGRVSFPDPCRDCQETAA